MRSGSGGRGVVPGAGAHLRFLPRTRPAGTPGRVEARLDALHDRERAGVGGRPRVVDAVGAVEHRAGARGERLAQRRDVGAGLQRDPGQPERGARDDACPPASARRGDHRRQVGRAAGDLHHQPSAALAGALRAHSVVVVGLDRDVVELDVRARGLGLVGRRGAAEAQQQPARARRSQPASKQSASSGRRGERERARAPARPGRRLAARRSRCGRAAGAAAPRPRRSARASRTSPRTACQVVAGDVLDHLAAGLGDRAVGRARR